MNTASAAVAGFQSGRLSAWVNSIHWGMVDPLWRSLAMLIIQSYALAVFMCIITMLCWGSWANTQKLAGREWRFQLYYWDYALGVLLLALVLAFTLGSFGTGGRSFLADLAQAD